MSRKRLKDHDVCSDEEVLDAKRKKAALPDDVDDEMEDEEEESLEMSQLATQDEKGSTIGTEIGVRSCTK